MRWSSALDRLPVLRFLARSVTADLEILSPPENVSIEFRIRFLTPYLRLPVSIDRSQIGVMDKDGRFTPTAFRFFDWHTWTHIEGEIDWEEGRTVDVNGTGTEVITGFVFRVAHVSVPAENYGLRLAEGVEGYVRVYTGRDIQRAKFEPFYWMIEPHGTEYDAIAIRDHELMVLIVSLSSLGSGNERVYKKSIERLEDWMGFKLGKKRSEKTMCEFLRYVRDWGPLRMDPLFGGLREILEKFEVSNPERLYFDLYAENSGVANNRFGRLLAVNMLKALGTEKAHVALSAIHDYTKNHDVPPQELESIQTAMRAVDRGLEARE